MKIDQAWLAGEFPLITGLAQIGEGGQKFVFAGDHDTDGPVVLKLFKLDADIARVQREVQAPLVVGSPRIPRVLEEGQVNSQLGELLWIREVRVPGESLREALKGGQMPDQVILRLGLHMLEALAAAEDASIVHRDVKPENIIIGPDGSGWLLDFGFARYLDLASLTATSDAWGKGTIGYAPPEQFRNDKPEIDGRADLFALGMTLYECVEGKHPFRSITQDAAEILRRVERQPLPRISRQVSSTEEFTELIYAMTRPRRNHRPETVKNALSWMQEICLAEGIS